MQEGTFCLGYMYARIEGETIFFLRQLTGIRIHLHHVNKTCQQLHHAYANSSAIDNSKKHLNFVPKSER
jgi:hypothetical protein